MTRRTQQERRAQMTGRLLDATTACLAEDGYGATSVKAICARAGVSQGALFNYFKTREDIIIAATERICDGHIAHFQTAAAAVAEAEGDMVAHLVAFVREAARSPRHAAWHEVIVAARTSPTLRSRVSASVERFEAGLLETAMATLPIDPAHAHRVGVVLLSVMHMFDSEAVTVAIFRNEAIENERVRWATELLRETLAAAI